MSRRTTKKSGARPTLLPRLRCVRRTMKEIGTRPTYCPDSDVSGEPRSKRKWVKGGESQGADLNLDDHIG